KLIMKDGRPAELYVDDKKIPSEQMNEYDKLMTAIEYAAEVGQKKDMEKMKMAQAEQEERGMKLDAERRELIEKLSALDAERAKLDHEKLQRYTDHEWEDAAKSDLLRDQMLKMQKENINEQDREKMRYQELLNQKLNSDNLFHQSQ